MAESRRASSNTARESQCKKQCAGERRDRPHRVATHARAGQDCEPEGRRGSSEALEVEPQVHGVPSNRIRSTESSVRQHLTAILGPTPGEPCLPATTLERILFGSLAVSLPHAPLLTVRERPPTWPETRPPTQARDQTEEPTTGPQNTLRKARRLSHNFLRPEGPQIPSPTSSRHSIPSWRRPI